MLLKVLLLGVVFVPQEGPDRISFQDRETIAGTVLGWDPDGHVRVRTSEGREYRFAAEILSSVNFGSRRHPRADFRSPKIYFAHGSYLSGTVVRFDGADFTIQYPGGRVRAMRRDVLNVGFAPLAASILDVKDPKGDVLILKEEQGEGNEAKDGRLVGIGKEDLIFRSGGKDLRIPRERLRHLYLRGEGTSRAMPRGWFVKAVLRNGDRMVGVISRLDQKRFHLFSHLVGELRYPREDLHSLSFIPFARTVVGHVLVCDRNGVREFDRNGKEVWSYSQQVTYAWGVKRLENGNTLIANTNYGQVLEVSPGREIVWRLSNLKYPYDAERLPNGNTLVAEYYANQVAEYDREGRKVWSSPAVRQPTSVQRLENGNTLVGSYTGVVEVDRTGKVTWRAPGRIYAWTARRLEGGTTLVVDRSREQVLEMEATGRVLWSRKGLSRPLSASRLENGNTLILEQGANRVIQVDPEGRIVSKIEGLNYPQAMAAF